MRIYLKPKKKRLKTNRQTPETYVVKNGIKYILCTVNEENKMYLNDIKNKKPKLK